MWGDTSPGLSFPFPLRSLGRKGEFPDSWRCWPALGAAQTLCSKCLQQILGSQDGLYGVGSFTGHECNPQQPPPCPPE